MTRALVACAWFGIQTWIGGSSIHQMLVAVTGSNLGTEVIAVLGITPAQLGCFMAFWLLQVRLCDGIITYDSMHTAVSSSRGVMLVQ